MSSPKKSSIADALLQNAMAGLSSNLISRHNNKAKTEADEIVNQASIVGTGELLINISMIDLNHLQPRKFFDQAAINDLAKSIEINGQIEPVVLRVVGDRYQLVAGERRLRAITLLGRESIQSVIKDISDENIALIALIENLEREGLTDYEIGLSIKEIEKTIPNKTELAKSLGRNRQDIYRYLSFNDLPEWVLDRLNANPSVINRSNAFELKALIKDNDYEPEKFRMAVVRAIDALENNALTQSLFLDKIKRFAREGVLVEGEGSKIKSEAFQYNGKDVGKIKFDDKKLTINIKSSVINQEDVDAIQAFINNRIIAK